MDDAVKVGPVQVTPKMLKVDQISKSRKRKKSKQKTEMIYEKQEKEKQQQSSLTQNQGDIQEEEEQSLKDQSRPVSGEAGEIINKSCTKQPKSASEAASLQPNSSSPSVLQDFKAYNEQSKKELQLLRDKQPIEFSNTIFDLFEKSINLKLQIQRQDIIEDMEQELHRNGFKLKERVARVIKKIFNNEIDLKDVFNQKPTRDKAEGDGEEQFQQQQKQQQLIREAMIPVDKMCKMCSTITKIEKPQPLLDQIETSDEEAPWKMSKRQRAIQETKKWIERQHVLLRDSGIDVEKTPLLNFEPKKFTDTHSTDKKRNLKEVCAEKFGTDGHNKLELKTNQILLDEVLRQVRLWSGKHANLIQALFKKQKALRLENQRLIQGKAHYMRDTLANTLHNLTVKLEKTQHNLAENLRLLDQSIKAQQYMDSNMSKVYDLFNGAGSTQKVQEDKLFKLQNRLVKWLPNFHKYGFENDFLDGLRFITEDYVLKDEEDDGLWSKQDIAQHFDTEKDRMWGITTDQNPDNISFNGKTLRKKYSKHELWLRSDIVRLTHIFNVATPEKVELEYIGQKFNMLQVKNNQMDDQIIALQKEVRTGNAKIEQLKQREISLLREQTLYLSENTKMKGIIDIPKYDKVAQVETLSCKVKQKLSKLDKKILSQHKKDMRRKTVLVSGRSKISIGQQSDDSAHLKLSQPLKPKLPKIETILSNRYNTETTPKQKEQQMIFEAGHWLNKLHEIDLEKLLYQMNQRKILKQLSWRRRHSCKQEFESRYLQLAQFFSQLMLKYPMVQVSAWQTFMDVMEDNGNDLMQGLHDLYKLGQEDWRFLLLQYVCGIYYNHTDDHQKIQACIVDKFESAPSNLVLAILINAKIDIDLVFGQQVDPDTMLDIDIIIQSLNKGLRNLVKDQRIFLENVFPQVIVKSYQYLLRDVEIIEAVSSESEKLERIIYQLNVKKIKSQAAREQVEFFNQIVVQISRVGLNKIQPDVQEGSDRISMENFMKFVKIELAIKLPEAYQKLEDFSAFVENRIVNFKQQSFNLDPILSKSQRLFQLQDDLAQQEEKVLTMQDLKSLEHVIIKRHVPIRKALLAAVHASQILVRIKQSFFEPIFNKYADRHTVGGLNLDGSFYQSLLFLANSNISNIFIGESIQSQAALKMSERARSLVNNLKKYNQKINMISLAKFTNVCLALDLLEYIPQSLKRIGRQSVMQIPKSMHLLSQVLQEINPESPKSGQIVHFKAATLLRNNELNKILNQSGRQFFMPVRYLACLYRSKYFQSIFDFNEDDRIAPSFNIFIDTELMELNRMVQIAQLGQINEKKVAVFERSSANKLSRVDSSLDKSRKSAKYSSPQARTKRQTTFAPKFRPQLSLTQQPTLKRKSNFIHPKIKVAEMTDNTPQQKSDSQFSIVDIESNPTSSIMVRQGTNSPEVDYGLNPYIQSGSQSPKSHASEEKHHTGKFQGISPQPIPNNQRHKNQPDEKMLEEIMESERHSFGSEARKQSYQAKNQNQKLQSKDSKTSEECSKQDYPTAIFGDKILLQTRSSQSSSSQDFKQQEACLTKCLQEDQKKQQPNNEVSVVYVKLAEAQDNGNRALQQEDPQFDESIIQLQSKMKQTDEKDKSHKKKKRLKHKKSNYTVGMHLLSSGENRVRSSHAARDRPQDQDTMTERRDGAGQEKSVTLNPSVSNMSSGGTLQPMKELIVEVNKTKVDPNDKERSLQYVLEKQEVSIEKHKKRIMQAHKAGDAVFHCYSIDSLEQKTINSDLDEFDFNQGQPPMISSPQILHAAKIVTKPHEFASYAVNHCEGRAGDLLGQGKGKITRVSLVPKKDTEMKYLEGQQLLKPPTSIQKNIFSNMSEQIQKSKLPQYAQKINTSNSRSKSIDRSSNSGNRNTDPSMRMSKHAETKIKLLSVFKKAHLRDSTAGQLVTIQDQQELRLVSELPSPYSVSSRSNQKHTQDDSL